MSEPMMPEAGPDRAPRRRRGRHRSPEHPIPAPIRVAVIVVAVAVVLFTVLFVAQRLTSGDSVDNPGQAVPEAPATPLEPTAEPSASDSSTSSPADTPAPAPSPTETPWTPAGWAKDQLRRFDAVAATADPGALVFMGKFGDNVDNTPVSVSGKWRTDKLPNGMTVGNNHGRALRAGKITSPDPLPTATTVASVKVGKSVRRLPVQSAQSTLAQLAAVNGPACEECEPIVVTGVTSTTTNVSTTEGRVQMPAWSYAVRGETARLVVPALAPTALLNTTPVWSGKPSAQVDAVMLPLWRTSLGKDGRTYVAHIDTELLAERLPAAESGLCWRLFADESDSAVAVYATHGKPVGTAPCVNEKGRVSVVFAKPLGSRTLLDVYWERAVSP